MRTREHRRFLTALSALALVLVLAAGIASAQEHGGGHAEPAADPHHEAAVVEPGEAHGAAHGEAHGEAHGKAHGGEFHLDNLVKLLIVNGFDDEKADALSKWIDPIYSLSVALIIAIFFISVSRSLRDRDPSRRQMFVEVLVGGLYDLFRSMLGDQARRFAPYLGTLFIFIYANNLFGIVPLGHSATNSFVNTTLGLGICTFLYAQYVGIRENGIGGYLYHFAGQPKSGLEWGFAILIFPLEVMGEIIKPISLSLRLFGNIFGEETLIAVMVVLGVQLMDFIAGSLGAGPGVLAWLPGLPLQVPFFAIALIGSTVQALVFTLLSTIYIALMLPHGHEEAH
ncbi:MAG: F0F1 ATP synthase subunit A [Candidatus Krumholzibacteriia bacterium]